MRKFVLSTFAAMSLMFASSAAQAIIYDLDLTAGSVDVTGFIETDDTIGTLSTGNILDFEVLLTAPGITNGLINPGNVIQAFISGTDFSATLTDLFFNFDGTGFLIIQGGTSNNFLCIEAENAGCSSQGHGISVGFQVISGTGPLRGNLSFATAASNGGQQVPEPGTLALFGIGLLGLGVAHRRRKTA